jgi:hypothetical protein
MRRFRFESTVDADDYPGGRERASSVWDKTTEPSKVFAVTLQEHHSRMH